jgi:orsellinic acid C2-O-methyltransferase
VIPIPALDAEVAPPDDGAARKYLLELINASWTTQVIASSVALGIVDVLAEKAQDIEGLARASSCHAPSLQRLISALASLDLVEQRSDGRVELTRTGALLRTDAGDSLAWWSLLCGGPSWVKWASLADSVRTGLSARRRSGSADDFALYNRDRAGAEVFNRAMSNLTKPVAEAIVEAIDFRGIDRIVDVGGSHGCLIGTILATYPGLRGTLFDLEHAISRAGVELARMGVAERCELVSGNFFDAIPGGADVYLLKSVLHDWDDQHCSAILQQCERAMTGGAEHAARLLVIERIRPEHFGGTSCDQAIARSDLNMLVSLGGRERTEREYRALLNAAGLRLERITELPSEFSVMEARMATSPLASDVSSPTSSEIMRSGIKHPEWTGDDTSALDRSRCWR